MYGHHHALVAFYLDITSDKLHIHSLLAPTPSGGGGSRLLELVLQHATFLGFSSVYTAGVQHRTCRRVLPVDFVQVLLTRIFRWVFPTFRCRCGPFVGMQRHHP